MKAIMDGVLTHGWEKRCILALTLNPENHHHVRTLNRILYTLLNAQTLLYKFGKLRRHERARPGNSDGRSQLGQQVDVRAGHSRMKDVANYRYVQSINAALVFANRQGIQQRLGRMLMRSVSGINDWRTAHSGQVMWRPSH
jgi:hypothetical protein